MVGHPETPSAYAVEGQDVSATTPVDLAAPPPSAPEEVPPKDMEKGSPDEERTASSAAASDSGDAADPDAETAQLLKGWRISKYEPSLCELNGSVKMPGADSKWCASPLPGTQCGSPILLCSIFERLSIIGPSVEQPAPVVFSSTPCR